MTRLVPNTWHLLVLLVAGISSVSSLDFSFATDDEIFAVGKLTALQQAGNPSFRCTLHFCAAPCVSVT
jgi:hypothetical protein